MIYSKSDLLPADLCRSVATQHIKKGKRGLAKLLMPQSVPHK